MFLSLFTMCFKKLNKKDTRMRIIVMLVIGVILLIISIIVSATATKSEDQIGGWFIVITYLIFFGWRLIADIILLLTKKLEE